MSATDGAWDAAVDNAIPTEKIRYGALETDDARDLFVIHAALLRNGKVLWFSGHAESMHYATVSFVFDPDTLLLHRVPFPGSTDLFCCHFAQLEDGRLLTVGGSEPDFNTRGSRGARNIVLFEPLTAAPFGRWLTTGKQLRQGRWYPTAVVLGDGRVLVFSGRLEAGRSSGAADIAQEVEVLSPPDFTPQLLSGANFELPLYPGLHLAPDGRIYYTHTNWGQQIPEPTDRALTVTGPTSGSWTNFGALPGEPRRREEGMSVLLPPAQDGKILVVGGSEAQDISDRPILQFGGTNTMDHIANPADPMRANILNTTAGGPPTWTPAPGGGATTHARINGHLVLLPDATVLVCGGHNKYKWYNTGNGTTPSRVAEIFTPSGPTAGFRTVASMTHPRMYHSAALLLPDGKVLVAGGADANSNEPTLPWPGGWPANLRWGATSFALNRKSREIYRPPYFFKGARPTITGVLRNGVPTGQIPYGSTFVVTSAEAADITVVALMRPGAATHHTDSEQRYVPLTFTRAGNNLTVTMLPQAQSAVAPPGYYMLWIVDNQQRPCGRCVFVQIPGPPRPPAPSSSWPCIVATVTMGSEHAAEVVLLRRVRDDLATESATGRAFVDVVNRLYYSFSPQVAAVIARRDLLRLATRDVVVRPAAAAVALVESSARLIPDSRVRQGVLMALLVLVALAGIALSPIVIIGTTAHIGLGLITHCLSRASNASASSGETRHGG